MLTTQHRRQMYQRIDSAELFVTSIQNRGVLGQIREICGNR